MHAKAHYTACKNPFCGHTVDVVVCSMPPKAEQTNTHSAQSHHCRRRQPCQHVRVVFSVASFSRFALLFVVHDSVPSILMFRACLCHGPGDPRCYFHVYCLCFPGLCHVTLLPCAFPIPYPSLTLSPFVSLAAPVHLLLSRFFHAPCHIVIVLVCRSSFSIEKLCGCVVMSFFRSCSCCVHAFPLPHSLLTKFSPRFGTRSFLGA